MIFSIKKEKKTAEQTELLAPAFRALYFCPLCSSEKPGQHALLIEEFTSAEIEKGNITEEQFFILKKVQPKDFYRFE